MNVTGKKGRQDIPLFTLVCLMNIQFRPWPFIQKLGMCKKSIARWCAGPKTMALQSIACRHRTFAPSSSLHLTIESSHRAIASSSLHHCATVIAASTEILLRQISRFHSFETVRSRRSKVLTGTVSVKDAANSGLHLTVTVIYQSGVPSGSV